MKTIILSTILILITSVSSAEVVHVYVENQGKISNIGRDIPKGRILNVKVPAPDIHPDYLDIKCLRVINVDLNSQEQIDYIGSNLDIDSITYTEQGQVVSYNDFINSIIP